MLEKLRLLPLEGTIFSGLLLLALFAPLAFGATHVWAYSLMEITIFLLLLLFLLKLTIRGHSPDLTELMALWMCAASFLAIVLFQLLPLPAGVVSAISPSSFSLFQTAIPGYETGDMWRCLSLNPTATKGSLLKYLAYFGAFVLCAYGFRKERNIEMLVIVLMAVGCFEVLYGLYERFGSQEVFGYPKIEHLDSVTGTYLNRNHLAGFLGMSITLSVGYVYGKFNHETHRLHTMKDKVISFINSPDALKYGLLLSAIIIMIIGLFFSLSRMGILSLFFSLLLMAVIAFFGKKGKMAFLAVGLLVFSMGVIALQGTEMLEKRFANIQQSAVSRLAIWQGTARMIADHPLFGTGLGAYESSFRAYVPELKYKKNIKIFNHAHNDYLELLAGVGLIGVVPVFLATVFLVVLFFRKWQERRNSFSHGIGLGGIGALSYMLLHSLADFNMHIPANAIVLAMILGLTYASLNIKHRSRRKGQGSGGRGRG